ncbi:GNAT family N-acetyltransferase [Fundicoccus ignavus]|uniref:GNAT family N-acetyltransferase n=1 Tax=Fundicoccus ignavus TaxID=2664442 RepID=A0A6I2GYQ1_9LACT|nr:GNAT family N-acetyltransferase [Fundicoccus ignavus]MRI82201.1 GNAT family N-acetyltransferase [Fundicoccus ignavus]MRI85553.1 GNAT family N-acetyltransferase [Fundicoccus ignavus]MRJ47363.1 GNAT family N-acetyltransferase [Fundicoccus ignavus]
MELVRENNAIVHRNENGEKLAEITFRPTADPDVVVADHTYVSPVLRGQGAAGKLLDRLVDEMKAENKKIKPLCSYVVKKFNEEPEKFDHINANA